MDQEDPRSYHYLEDGASLEIRTLIDARVADVYAARSQPGAGGYLTCLATVGAWRNEFEAAGIRVEQLGCVFDNRTWHEGGGYLRPDEVEPSDHHWLAVGDGLWLFDPTASQFAVYGPPDLSRYITFDGRRFPAWRKDRIHSSHGRP